MGTHREIDLLKPALKEAVERTFIAFEKAGLKVLVSETLRDLEVQQAYYAQGRKPLAEVNELRKKAGLYLLGEAENKNIVTYCDGIKNKSNHQTRDASGLGSAIDLVPARYDEKRKYWTFWWNAPEEVWRKMGMIAEENGLDWCAGGKGEHWNFDNPHFELLTKIN